MHSKTFALWAAMAGGVLAFSALIASPVLADFGPTPAGFLCDDSAEAACNGRGASPGEPRQCATGASGTEPCTTAATAPAGTKCKWADSPADPDECHCKGSTS